MRKTTPYFACAFLLIACGGDEADTSTGYIQGERLTVQRVDDFLTENSIFESELINVYSTYFPLETELEPSCEDDISCGGVKVINTVVVGKVSGAGFFNDVVFGFSGYDQKPINIEIQMAKLYLDTDMNKNTGYKVNEIGADVMLVSDSQSGVYIWKNEEVDRRNEEFGIDSQWWPRETNGNTGAFHSNSLSNSHRNMQHIAAVYSSSDLLESESRAVARMTYSTYGSVTSGSFYIPGLSLSDNSTGLPSSTNITQEFDGRWSGQRLVIASDGDLCHFDMELVVLNGRASLNSSLLDDDSEILGCQDAIGVIEFTEDNEGFYFEQTSGSADTQYYDECASCGEVIPLKIVSDEVIEFNHSYIYHGFTTTIEGYLRKSTSRD